MPRAEAAGARAGRRPPAHRCACGSPAARPRSSASARGPHHLRRPAQRGLRRPARAAAVAPEAPLRHAGLRPAHRHGADAACPPQSHRRPQPRSPAPPGRRACAAPTPRRRHRGPSRHTGCAELQRPRGSGHVRLRDRRRRLGRLRARRPADRGPGRVSVLLLEAGRPDTERASTSRLAFSQLYKTAVRLGLRDRARAARSTTAASTCRAARCSAARRRSTG